MDIKNIPLNPIDIVEDVIYQKKWSFSRSDDYELVADLASKWCQYRLYFSWSENVRAMSFTITFDLKYPQSKLSQAYELIGLINEKLWIGHFDITSKNGIPAFRQVPAARRGHSQRRARGSAHDRPRRRAGAGARCRVK